MFGSFVHSIVYLFISGLISSKSPPASIWWLHLAKALDTWDFIFARKNVHKLICTKQFKRYTKQFVFTYCQNPNSTQAKVGFDVKMTLHTTTGATTNSMSARCQLLLSRFWPNFIGSFLGSTTTTSTTKTTRTTITYHWPYFEHILKLGFWINNNNNNNIYNNKNNNKNNDKNGNINIDNNNNITEPILSN